MTFAQHGEPKSYAASDMMRSDLETVLLMLAIQTPKVMERDAMRSEIAQLKAEVSKYRDLQPAAVRHSYDGYGWLYVDNGSGSSWLQVGMKYPHAEVLFSKSGQSDSQASLSITDDAQPAIQHLPADDTEGGAL
jgi:hypothetical protein